VDPGRRSPRWEWILIERLRGVDRVGVDAGYGRAGQVRDEKTHHLADRRRRVLGAMWVLGTDVLLLLAVAVGGVIGIGIAWAVDSFVHWLH
jgi:hypothetical protein